MKKAYIVYWTLSGNTEMMAEAIAKGMRQSDCEADVVPVSEAGDLGNYDFYAFGCPAMGAEVLEEGEFDPYFTEIEGMLANKKVALFGSYGWGDGEWMRNWETRIAKDHACLFENGLIINGTPDNEGLAECESFGERFVKQ